ncbi:uncharacterized protein DS421_13g405200 [Arachis hypogaea]|nr:uncharacterized protein DS421_13g405200 [Arachis hypogaea]
MVSSSANSNSSLSSSSSSALNFTPRLIIQLVTSSMKTITQPGKNRLWQRFMVKIMKITFMLIRFHLNMQQMMIVLVVTS